MKNFIKDKLSNFLIIGLFDFIFYFRQTDIEQNKLYVTQLLLVLGLINFHKSKCINTKHKFYVFCSNNIYM